MAAAYRDYARTHPGRYPYVLRARPDDVEHRAAATELLSMIYDVLAGYAIMGEDAVDAARFLRATLHGFVSLEARGGFGLPRSVNHFDRLVDALDHALATWSGPGQPSPTS